MLKIRGIESEVVFCNLGTPMFFNKPRKEDKRYGILVNHAIIKIYLDGNEQYYSDVTLSAQDTKNNRAKRFFLESRKEIKKTHQLLDENNDKKVHVDGATKEIPFYKKLELEAFAKKRILEIEREKQAAKHNKL